MIEFKTLTLKNFMSYGNNTNVISLCPTGTVLIRGINGDVGGGGNSNGVGKTAVIHALTYALYGRSLFNINKDNLVNNINKRDMEVSLTFNVHQHEYTIVRRRKNKANSNNAVKFFKNGVDITKANVADVDKDILNIIKIPFALFARTVIFSGSFQSFFDLPLRSASGDSQTGMIETLFNLQLLTIKSDHLKNIIKSTENAIASENIKLDTHNKILNQHNNQLNTIRHKQTDWETQKTNNIKKLQQQIQVLSDVNVEEQLSLIQVRDEVKVALVEWQQPLTEIMRKQSQVLSASKRVLNELNHLKDGHCPYCMQDYTKPEKIRELENEKADLTEQLEQLILDQQAHESKVSELKARMQQITSGIVFDDVHKLTQSQQDLLILTTKCKELEQSVNPFTDVVREMELDTPKNYDLTTLNELAHLLNHQKLLLKLLTKKDSFVRKTLLERNIPFLNEKLKYYTSHLGLLHTVEFTHEMTARITRFDRELDYNNLSTGQKARVNLALSMAFRDVLELSIQKVNLFITDESLDMGLDFTGIMSAAKLLKQHGKNNKSIFVISHREELHGVFDRILNIKLEKSFSHIQGEYTV